MSAAVRLMALSVDEQGAPVLEGASVACDAQQWRTIRVDGETVGHVYTLLLGLYFVCGPSDHVSAWASGASSAWSLAALRQDTSEGALLAKRQIPWWRLNAAMPSRWGQLTIAARVFALPTPIPGTPPSVETPWVAGDLTITELIEPVFGATVAGYDYPSDAELTV